MAIRAHAIDIRLSSDSRLSVDTSSFFRLSKYIRYRLLGFEGVRKPWSTKRQIKSDIGLKLEGLTSNTLCSNPASRYV